MQRIIITFGLIASLLMSMGCLSSIAAEASSDQIFVTTAANPGDADELSGGCPQQQEDCDAQPGCTDHCHHHGHCHCGGLTHGMSYSAPFASKQLGYGPKDHFSRSDIGSLFRPPIV